MRQFAYHTAQNRLLIFLFLTLVFLLSGNHTASAQRPTVLIDKAIDIKDSLFLNLRIKRFKSQNLTLELKLMNSEITKRFTINKSFVIEEGDNCFIKLRLRFPPGDTQILLYDDQNLAICNPRRQNTDENAKDYDPSKGHN